MLRYLFVDMNSYFASVEQQDNPALRNRPVGVLPTLVDSTCCIAASYEAKAFGVKTGMGARQARQLCPQIAMVEARPKLYVEYHHRIVAAVESCLHVDQVCSIDEMYGRLMGDEREPANAEKLAKQVKAAIRGRLGPWIRCSAGLGPNVWLSKVATEMQKPDGLVMILSEQLPEKLFGLKLTDLPGIGGGMHKRLARSGVTTVRQLCSLPKSTLEDIWASKVMADIWWSQLRGEDLPAKPTHRRSVGQSHVLPPEFRTDDGSYAVMVRLVHKAAARLRRLGYRAGRITFRVRYLQGYRWKRTAPLHDCQDTLTLIRCLSELWPTRPGGKPLKVSVDLTHLTAEGNVAGWLYDEMTRGDRLSGVMDAINDKFGRQVVYFGAQAGAEQTAPARISFTQIPNLKDFS